MVKTTLQIIKMYQNNTILRWFPWMKWINVMAGIVDWHKPSGNQAACQIFWCNTFINNLSDFVLLNIYFTQANFNRSNTIFHHHTYACGYRTPSSPSSSATGLSWAGSAEPSPAGWLMHPLHLHAAVHSSQLERQENLHASQPLFWHLQKAILRISGGAIGLCKINIQK